MAKELPYYQFEPAEYLAGDIMLCSLEAQGLFAVVKSLYWQKDCDLNTKQVLKRFKGSEGLIEELTEESVLKVDYDGRISISFLDEQYEQLKTRRNKLSAAGKKGRDSQIQATPKPSPSHPQATPKHLEEKRKEEKRIEEKREDLRANDETVKEFQEAIKKSKPLLDYWSINEISNHKSTNIIASFVLWHLRNNTYDELIKTLEAYKLYKKTTEQQVHGFKNWIGEPSENYSNGAWCGSDWKKLASSKQKKTFAKNR